MPFSSDFIFAKGTTQSEWDFLAIPGNVPTTTPTWGYTTKFQGIDPRFKIGGELRGWFYGVLGAGGHAVDEGRKVGPTSMAIPILPACAERECSSPA
jgi:hypothetical protein